MASRRHENRRKCEGKRGHPSIEAAIREASRLRRQRPGEEYDAYGCQRCGLFHVGHRRQEVRRILAARRGEI